MRIRLEMHNDQLFLDGNDAYVWIYDPTPWYYYIAGTAIVLGIIAVCLFPLWPMEARQGVYYLSVAAAGFLVFIIVLAIIKYILFLLCFIATMGKLKLWIFPNLTEDVGFFESFWPMYVYTYDHPKKKKTVMMRKALTRMKMKIRRTAMEQETATAKEARQKERMRKKMVSGRT